MLGKILQASESRVVIQPLFFLINNSAIFGCFWCYLIILFEFYSF